MEMHSKFSFLPFGSLCSHCMAGQGVGGGGMGGTERGGGQCTSVWFIWVVHPSNRVM